MALVDTFGTGAGASRLLMMQARFQQRQQEEKEHKLFAMLEEQHEGIGLIPATRTHSNGSSQNGQHTSASSTASLTSSLGSSLASSLGSTGSGTGGKVRQMFEERRNNINGRPPVHSNGLVHGTKNNQLRRASPNKPGWDRSYPLEPMPTTYEKNTRSVPATNRYNRSRGVSLERGGNQLNDSGEMRRSKSQYQVAAMAASENDTLAAPNGLKPKSMNSLVDDNQNNMIETRRTGNRFGYNPHGRSPSEPRYREPGPQYREDGDVSNGNGASRRNHINQQTFRKVPASYPANRTLGNGPAEWPPGGGSSEDAARAAALAAAEAAAETARKLEAEKLRIQMDAKKREEELMNTIRQQQLQLQRFQQAAALAEQKAKVASAAAAPPTPRSTATANVVTASKFRRPNADYGTRAAAAAIVTDESDDSKSTLSDEVFNSPPNKGWPPAHKKPINEAPAEPAAMSKPKLAPKPAAPARQPVQRRSIFATAMASAKEGLVSCSICGRNFASDRIEKHESVCAKTKTKKRKVFDITKMRVKGTEAEGYVLHAPVKSNHPAAAKKGAGHGGSSGGYHPPSNPLAAYAATLPSAKNDQLPTATEDSKKADWRKKHESFLETIRAAKAVTKHLKNGGKISDLPPPPPSDTSDYIQCPHCKRRFSPGAADRHIPKCANIKSNKPK